MARYLGRALAHEIGHIYGAVSPGGLYGAMLGVNIWHERGAAPSELMRALMPSGDFVIPDVRNFTRAYFGEVMP